MTIDGRKELENASVSILRNTDPDFNRSWSVSANANVAVRMRPYYWMLILRPQYRVLREAGECDRLCKI
jgi:hypothetical protein